MKKFEIELPDWIVKDLEESKGFYTIEELISMLIIIHRVKFLDTDIKMRFGKYERDR